MKRLIGGAIRNTPAMNTLMISLLLVGTISLLGLRREVFPEFDLEMILVTVPYPGASPEEVEEGICQKIEEAVRTVDGIHKQVAVAQEGSGMLVLELQAGVSVQRVLGDVRAEIDRIGSFPLLAEDPEVKQVTLRQPAIRVAVVGPPAEDSAAQWRLRELAERVRDELIRLPAVSHAEILGAKDYQIDIEISEATLRRQGLTLQEVARLVRRENLELPAGTIRTDAQEVLVKGKNKKTIGREIAQIPLVSQADGAVLTVGDLGSVRDGFADVTSETWINGRPGLVISVDRASHEDLLAMTDAVHGYVDSQSVPAGYELQTWNDRSVEVRDRLELLRKNGLQGLALVLLTLAIFLNPRLAFWVSLGIPVSILGASAVLLYTGHTLNMLTTFTFIMALGIVVDDAIVIGENIFTHRQNGAGWLQAAIGGTAEVVPSVIASVTTTIIAFVPLMFVTGIMGKFIAVMPLAMIAMLVISLLESCLVLPCHLAHAGGEGPVVWTGRLRDRLPGWLRWTAGSLLLALVLLGARLLYPVQRLGDLFVGLNARVGRLLELLGRRLYLPLLRFSLSNPATVFSAGAAMLLLTAALVRGGIVPFVVFPKLDSNLIEARITYPDGTPAAVTDRATRQLEQAIGQVDGQYRQQDMSMVRLIQRSVGFTTGQYGAVSPEQGSGSHLGAVTAELVDSSARPIRSEQIVAQWRRLAGEFPGAESLVFASSERGPGGTPIEFKLLAPAEQMDGLRQAVDRTKDRLRQYPGVFDVADDSQPGKWEFQLRVKPDAVAMGVPLAELAETVRASYYGEEVMRLQRGRHEVKLMARYPQSDRVSLADFEQIRIRTGEAAERPLTELADVDIARGYSELNRVDQLRSITVSADVDESLANARQIVRNLQAEFMPGLLEQHPDLSVRWEGQQEQTTESVESLMKGLLVALVAIFVLLTWQFNSYFQPLLIMAIIPFGFVGAVAGHALLGLPLTLFSLFGLVTLTGIVINDSIVLIDFINHRVRQGMPLEQALEESGLRRMRPILLTSLTTIAGLLPLLLERSIQAQVLIPMAVSLCFGLALATGFILLLVPTFYLVHARLTARPPAGAGQRTAENGRIPMNVGT